MKNIESHNGKLWLEESGFGANKKTIKYEKVDFNLSKNEATDVQRFIKANKIRFEVLIKASWGLLLSKLSTADEIVFGCSTTTAISKNPHKVHEAIQPIKIGLNSKLTTKNYIKKIQSQIAKKTNILKKSTANLRYLLIFKGKDNKKNYLLQLDPQETPVILYADIDSPNKFSIIYSNHSFSNKSITQLASCFKVLLQNICHHYHENVVKLDILTDNDKDKLINKFNNPKYDFSVPILTKCVHEYLTHHAITNPGNLAIKDSEQSISYKELDETANKLAQILVKNGVKPGDHVCVSMERTAAWIMTIIAIFKAGAVYVPINPKFPNDRIEFVLSDCQPRIVLVNDTDRLPNNHSYPILVITPQWNTLAIEDVNLPLPSPNSDNIAYIIYTSGTTGQPKGVRIKHKSIINLIAWYESCFKVSHQDKVSQFGSQGFDSHICEIAPALALGASICIVDDNTKLTPSLFFDWLQRENISICDLTTAYAQLLFAMHWPKKMSLRLMKIGGETLTHYPSPEMNFDVWNIYGPTEATIEATFMKIHSANNPIHSLHSSIPPIGKPITGSKVYIVDPYLQLVPIGVGGELLIGGIVIANGYLNNQALTNEKFIPNPFDHADNGLLYRTGDLVRWLPDGNLEFIGRIDNQIKLRGFRIELSDIENAISHAPDVNKVIVLLKENVHNEKSLVAYTAPNLEKQRYLFQQRCLVSLDNNHYIEAITEDISKNGMAISGINETLSPGQQLKIQVKLPGFNESKLLTGNVIWYENRRCGIAFNMSESGMQLVQKSIDYHLSSNNVMELILSASAKRSLRRALQQKVPDYMIPSIFVTLMNFPLTLSGKIDLKALPSPQNFDQLIHKEYIAPKTSTEKRLAHIWESLLHKDNVSMNDNFFDLGGTSLTAADLSVRILNEFKTSVPAKILFDLSYIPILAEYIDSNGTAYSQQPFIDAELKRDCSLADNYHPSMKLHPNSKNPKNILLTGAGGYLGVFLLKELLKKSDAKIYCLIRKGDFDTAAKRLMEALRNFNLEKEINLNDRRIVVIASDISFDNFGLPLEQYNSLLDKIDTIYHCGAQVNIMASYNKLRASNVIGTLEVIKFATQHYDKPIHYISTLSSAYLKNNQGELAEYFPDDNYTELFGGYAISKWVSERLLTSAKNRGLPVSLYRSGYISGESTTGITHTNDALLLLIKGCIQLGYAPDMYEKITILPVDFVSKLVVDIAFSQPDASQVYHVDHPTGILWTDLVAWLNNYGFNIKIITMNEWQSKLTKIGQDNALYPFLPYYLAIAEHQKSPDVSICNVTKLIKEMPYYFPELNDTLLTNYFDYLLSIQFLPAEKHHHSTGRHPESRIL